MCTLLAILAGAFPELLLGVPVTGILLVLGILVGLLNVTEKETQKFLVAAVALLIAGGAAALETIPEWASSILTNIASFVAPAAVIVALNAIYALAKE